MQWFTGFRWPFERVSRHSRASLHARSAGRRERWLAVKTWPAWLACLDWAPAMWSRYNGERTGSAPEIYTHAPTTLLKSNRRWRHKRGPVDCDHTRAPPAGYCTMYLPTYHSSIYYGSLSCTLCTSPQVASPSKLRCCAGTMPVCDGDHLSRESQPRAN